MNLVQMICCALLTKVADLATDQTIGARIGDILSGGSRRLEQSTPLLPIVFDELKIAGSEICVCAPKAEATPEEAPKRRLRSWRRLKFDKP